MSKQEQLDVYAETHILEVKPAVLHVLGRDSDNLALYDEYERELGRAAAADATASKPKKRASARPKR
jgi:hypothetical protein